jgi:glycosyltransferase involved in cell wall biosynthesis
VKLRFFTATDTKKALVDKPMAVRSVEMSCPLPNFDCVKNYWGIRVFVTYLNNPIGYLDIINQHQTVSAERLKAEIASKFDRHFCLDRVNSHPAQPPFKLTSHLSVSIIVATCDRPSDLRRCLQQLLAQETNRPIEIIVVDNRPDSGLTPPVVAEFPEVTLLSESRAGSSYARNAGIAHSHGDIIVTIDDDVSVPAQWLETLLMPFNRPQVMAVTGNILPLELSTTAQQLFEIYGEGGLGRGFQAFEVNQAWLERSPIALPTWELGTTANAAFRAELFQDPQVGLMEETLGAGMPVGGGEDLYFFYKILKAGHTMVYQSSAYVWHRHRRNLNDLRRQIYNYSKGLFAYYLMTVLHHGERSPLRAMFFSLPLYQVNQLLSSLTGQSAYPASLIFVELAGYLAAAWSLWRSHLRVRRNGRSIYTSASSQASRLKPLPQQVDRSSPVLSSVN